MKVVPDDGGEVVPPLKPEMEPVWLVVFMQYRLPQFSPPVPGGMGEEEVHSSASKFSSRAWADVGSAGRRVRLATSPAVRSAAVWRHRTALGGNDAKNEKRRRIDCCCCILRSVMN